MTGTTDDGGNSRFASVPAGTYSLEFSDTVALSADSGWSAWDGGTVTLAYSGLLPGIAFDGGMLVLNATLYPGKRVASEASELVVADGGGYFAIVEQGVLQVGRTPTPSILTALGSSIGPNIQFAPSGTSLAFSEIYPDAGAALEFSSISGTPVPVGGAHSFSISLDGQYLMALIDVDPNLDLGTLVLVSTFGAFTQLGVNVPTSQPYSFSSDSMHAAFTVDYDDGTGAGTLEVIDVTNPASPIAINGYDSFNFSPDGEYVAYTTSDLPYGCAVASVSEPSTISELSGDHGGDTCAFSSSGDLVAYNVLDGGNVSLAVADLDSSDSTTLLPISDQEGFRPILFSPDGMHVAFAGLNSGNVYLSNTAGQGVSTLLAAVGEPAFLSFSKDSAYLIMSALDGYLFLSTMSNPSSSRTANLGQINLPLDTVLFSNDSHHLAFLGGPSAPLLEVVDTSTAITDGGGITSVSLNVTSFTFSEDSQYLAFESGGILNVALRLPEWVNFGLFSMVKGAGACR